MWAYCSPPRTRTDAAPLRCPARPCTDRPCPNAREDLSGVLPSILAPTLFATGDDHSEWTPAEAESAAGLTPRGSSVSLPGTAYILPLEAPAQTATLVIDHWRASADAP
ncbi:hypothetical protein GCM10027449_02070 [Sinomonas notoginsengisoli]